jgi:cyclophilin family peptidyl-prolyl cis-trans isomerase
MIRSTTIGLILVILAACSKPQVVVTKEFLLQYGKANPENKVKIETDLGTIRLHLYDDTPLHRANFVRLIKEGHYKNADFYRVVFGFMIQGGDKQNQLPYKIPAEFRPEHYHKKGALSMAREDVNNPEMESSAAEFFIVHGNRYDLDEMEAEARVHRLSLTPEQKEAYTTVGGYMSLDQKYTVFGEVTEGLDVVDKIANERVVNIDRPKRKIPFTISVEK